MAMVSKNLILQRSDDLSSLSEYKKASEGSLHPRPKGQGIRDPLRSHSNKLCKKLFMDKRCSPTKYFLIEQQFNINYDIIVFLLQNISIELFSLKSMRINLHQVPIFKIPHSISLFLISLSS